MLKNRADKENVTQLQSGLFKYVHTTLQMRTTNLSLQIFVFIYASHCAPYVFGMIHEFLIRLNNLKSTNVIVTKLHKVCIQESGPNQDSFADQCYRAGNRAVVLYHHHALHIR